MTSIKKTCINSKAQGGQPRELIRLVGRFALYTIDQYLILEVRPQKSN